MVKAECLPSMSQINNLSSFLTCPGPGTVRYEYNKIYILDDDVLHDRRYPGTVLGTAGTAARPQSYGTGHLARPGYGWMTNMPHRARLSLKTEYIIIVSSSKPTADSQHFFFCDL